MKLEAIKGEFSVCKVADYSLTDLSAPFVFTGATDEERSLVCPTVSVPENTTDRDDGWRAFRVKGTLDFSLTGILARLSAVLAENKIGIFPISNVAENAESTDAAAYANRNTFLITGLCGLLSL